MLDLVPLAGARWQMMDLDVDADLGGKSVEFALPKTNAGAVAATTICRDHEVLGVRIADPSDLIPPATDGLLRELCRVVVHADTDPAGIGGQVVDTIRHRSAQFLDQEVVHSNRFGHSFGPPRAAGILEVTD